MVLEVQEGPPGWDSQLPPSVGLTGTAQVQTLRKVSRRSSRNVIHMESLPCSKATHGSKYMPTCPPRLLASLAFRLVSSPPPEDYFHSPAAPPEHLPSWDPDSPQPLCVGCPLSAAPSTRTPALELILIVMLTRQNSCAALMGGFFEL